MASLDELVKARENSTPSPIRTSNWLGAIPGLADQFREIPEAFYEQHGDPEDNKVRIYCPCGHRPVLKAGEIMACRRLASSPHRCPRIFTYSGVKARVALSPKS